MRYMKIGISACCVLLVLCSINPKFLLNSGDKRYIQHLNAKLKGNCEKLHENELCSNLPLVIIDTHGKDIPGAVTGKTDIFAENICTTAEDGSEAVVADVKLIDNDGKTNHIEDLPLSSFSALIHVRGHASRSFEKSSYLVALCNDAETEVFGMPAHNKWVLHGPYIDKSLLRNYLWYNLAGQIMDYAPDVRFCELVLNGEYEGVYLITETVSNGEKRLPLTVTHKGHTLAGYLLRTDRTVENELTETGNISSFIERAGFHEIDISIRYPGEFRLDADTARKIELEYAAFEKAVYSYDFKDAGCGYLKYLNLYSFIDYAVINELSMNQDAGRFSTYIYKIPAEKYRMCVWDFNNSCDNFSQEQLSVSGFVMHNKPLFEMLYRDDYFTDCLVKRYRQLRRTVLSDENIDAFLSGADEYLGDARIRNENRWESAYASDLLSNPATRNDYSQQDAVSRLRRTIHARASWLDDNIDTVRQYSAESAIKQYTILTY